MARFHQRFQLPNLHLITDELYDRRSKPVQRASDHSSWNLKPEDSLRFPKAWAVETCALLFTKGDGQSHGFAWWLVPARRWGYDEMPDFHHASNVIEGDLDSFLMDTLNDGQQTNTNSLCHFVWKDLQSARGNHCKYCQTASFVGFEGRQSQHKASHWLVQAVWSAARNGGWWGILSMSLWSPAFWDVCCDGLGTRKHRIAKMTAVI